MCAKLAKLGQWLIGLVVVYTLLNLIQFSWFLSSPEGYWSLWAFVETFSALFFALFLTLWMVFFLYRQIAIVFEERRGRITVWMLIKPFLFTALFGLFATWTLFQASAFNFWLSRSMAERYSYLTKSRKLIEEGRLQEAMSTAERVYKKGKMDNNTGCFFIFSHLYQSTDGYQKSTSQEQYEASINMAYCIRAHVPSTQAAETYLKEALRLSQNKFLRAMPEYAIYPQIELAELYLSQGRYEHAESLFSNAKRLVSAAGQSDVLEIINLNEVFARAAEVNSDKERAFGLRKESLKLYEQSGMSKKNEFYHQLVLLVAQYSLLYHQVTEAGNLILKIMPTIEKHKRKELYSNYLKVRSLYCSAAAELEERDERIIEPSYWERLITLFSKTIPVSEKFYRESERCALAVMEFRQERSELESQEMVVDLSFLATFYTNRAKYAEAARIHLKSLQILRKNKVANERYYYQILLSLACSEALSGHINQDARLAEFEAWISDKLARNFVFLTAREREAFANELEVYLSSVNLVYLKDPTPEHLEKIFNNTLLIKNLAFYSERQLKKMISEQGRGANSAYEQILVLQNQLQEKRQRLAPQEFNKLQEIVDQRERKLTAELTKDSGNLLTRVSASWNKVYGKLSGSQSVVEFIRITEHKGRAQYYRYYALVGTKQLDYPQLVALCTEQELEAALDQKGGEKERIEAIYNRNSTKLYDLVWAAIHRRLAGVNKVFISPYGALHQVSFNALLASENIDISILGSSRVIIERPATPKQINAMLFGDIAYGTGNHDIKGNGPKVDKRRNGLPYFHTLPFSLSEVNEISMILRSAKCIYR